MYQLWDTNIFIKVADGYYVGPPKIDLPVAVSPATVAETVAGDEKSSEYRLRTIKKICEFSKLYLSDSSFHIRLLFGKEDLGEGAEKAFKLNSVLQGIANEGSFTNFSLFVQDMTTKRSDYERQLRNFTLRGSNIILETHRTLGGDRAALAKELVSDPKFTLLQLVSFLSLLEGREIGNDEPISTEYLSSVYGAFEVFLRLYSRYVREEGTKKQGVFLPDANDFGDLLQLLFIQPTCIWVTDEKKWHRFAEEEGLGSRIIWGKQALSLAGTLES